MKHIKAILTFLWLLIYRQSPYYVINRIKYVELKYETVWLYRKDYILYFIPKLIPIDHTDSIGNNLDKISIWYRLYDQRLNGLQTIKEITYEKV